MTKVRVHSDDNNSQQLRQPRAPSSYIIVIALSLICAGAVFFYGRAVCASPNDDPLTLSYFSSPWDSFLDGWGLMHFLFFALLTTLFPRLWWLIFLLGVGWEILEYYMNTSTFTTCSKRKENREKNGMITHTAEEYKWWYARWQDVVMNTVGIGVALLLYAAFEFT